MFPFSAFLSAFFWLNIFCSFVCLSFLKKLFVYICSWVRLFLYTSFFCVHLFLHTSVVVYVCSCVTLFLSTSALESVCSLYTPVIVSDCTFVCLFLCTSALQSVHVLCSVHCECLFLSKVCSCERLFFCTSFLEYVCYLVHLFLGNLFLCMSVLVYVCTCVYLFLFTSALVSVCSF